MEEREDKRARSETIFKRSQGSFTWTTSASGWLDYELILLHMLHIHISIILINEFPAMNFALAFTSIRQHWWLNQSLACKLAGRFSKHKLKFWKSSDQHVFSWSRIRGETCSGSGWLQTASLALCPKSFSCLKTLLWVSGPSSLQSK